MKGIIKLFTNIYLNIKFTFPIYKSSKYTFKKKQT